MNLRLQIDEEAVKDICKRGSERYLANITNKVDSHEMMQMNILP